jgi:hypothetical protein
LKLTQVHISPAYDLISLERVNAYIQEREAKAEAVRKESETRFPPKDLRERLLAEREEKQ